jgi:hypothetical protein
MISSSLADAASSTPSGAKFVVCECAAVGNQVAPSIARSPIRNIPFLWPNLRAAAHLDPGPVRRPGASVVLIRHSLHARGVARAESINGLACYVSTVAKQTARLLVY